VGTFLIAATLASVATGSVGAVDTAPHSHIHAKGEIDEDQPPLLVETTYIADSFVNAGGGRKRGYRYLDNLDLVLEADLEALTGWRGASVHLYGIYNNGNSLSERVGDAQIANNIETGTPAVRLYEAWVQQKIAPGASLRFGLYDLNSEFDSLDSSGLFIGSGHCIGSDIAQSGTNGPSIFPSTSLALRASIEAAPGWTLRAAVLDGVPGDPRHPGRTAIKLSDQDGALIIGEIEVPLAHGKLLLGHWQYTAQSDNSGYYLRGESCLFRESEGHQGLDGFFRAGHANARFNSFDWFASAGFNYTGLFAGRDEDQLGIAFASAFGPNSGGTETSFELTYRARLLPWLTLQPNVQYIVNPGMDPLIENAFIVGLRTEISFRLFE